MKRSIEETYFDWLAGQLPTHKDVYGHLIRALWDRPFIAVLPDDSNRISDGLALRGRYAWINKLDSADEAMLKECRPCSVLEVMLALSFCIEEEYLGSYDDEDPIGKWFHRMLKSLGMSYCTDSFYVPERVDKTISDLLNRTYKPDGSGGLFWIPGSKEDLRTVDLWRQMMMFINEIVRRSQNE